MTNLMTIYTPNEQKIYLIKSLNVLTNGTISRDQYFAFLVYETIEEPKKQLGTMISSSWNGKISEIHVKEGDLVEGGSPLCAVLVSDDELSDVELSTAKDPKFLGATASYPLEERVIKAFAQFLEVGRELANDKARLDFLEFLENTFKETCELQYRHSVLS